MGRACVSVVLAALCACAPARFDAVGPNAKDTTTTIEKVELHWSNVYLLRNGPAFALVDSGSPIDRDLLYAALARAGVNPRELRLVILTHAHADHCGLARLYQLYGAKIVLGTGDLEVAAAGENPPLHATSLLASAVAPMFMFPFDPFTPDIAIEAQLDLTRYGFPDVRVIQMPGHTPGSLVIQVGAKEALVGDMITGGWFGGVFREDHAGEHYYQANVKANHRNVAALLMQGIVRFYVGHGGPLERNTVTSWVLGVDSTLMSSDGVTPKTKGAP